MANQPEDPDEEYFRLHGTLPADRIAVLLDMAKLGVRYQEVQGDLPRLLDLYVDSFRLKDAFDYARTLRKTIDKEDHEILNNMVADLVELEEMLQKSQRAALKIINPHYAEANSGPGHDELNGLLSQMTVRIKEERAKAIWNEKADFATW